MILVVLEIKKPDSDRYQNQAKFNNGGNVLIF